MKLYTEEQVRQMLKSTHIHTDNDVDMIIPKFNPIELPSDEEIREERLLQFPDSEYATSQACTGCHSRSGRIALSYYGWHEGTALLSNTPTPHDRPAHQLPDGRLVRAGVSPVINGNDEYAVEVPLIEWNGHKLMRISIQGYNTRRDANRLHEALIRLL